MVSLEMRTDDLKNETNVFSVIELGVVTHYDTPAIENMRAACKHTCDIQHQNCQKVPQR